MAVKASKKTTNIPPHVGPNLKKWRLARGLTQSELGEMIGCQKGHISGAENGKGNLSLPRFLEICQALEVPASRVLEERLMKDHRDFDRVAAKLVDSLGMEDVAWLASLPKAHVREAMERAHERVTVLELEGHRKSKKAV